MIPGGNIMKRSFSTKELAFLATFTAILCVSAYISIPTPLPAAAHITLLNFMILLAALIFPLRDSVIMISLWLIMGLFAPVYIGGAMGIGYLFGIFGGYTWSFLIAAIFIGLTKGKTCHRIRYTIVSILAAILIDIIGMFWWKFSGNLSWKVAFFSGFAAFLPLDLIKAVAAAQLAPVFKRLLPDV